MKYEITILKNGKQTENFIATDYKTISCKGRLGHTIEEREIDEVNILPDGKKRNKNYSVLWNTIIIQELETGRRVLTLEQKF